VEKIPLRSSGAGIYIDVYITMDRWRSGSVSCRRACLSLGETNTRGHSTLHSVVDSQHRIIISSAEAEDIRATCENMRRATKGRHQPTIIPYIGRYIYTPPSAWPDFDSVKRTVNPARMYGKGHTQDAKYKIYRLSPLKAGYCGIAVLYSSQSDSCNCKMKKRKRRGAYCF